MTRCNCHAKPDAVLSRRAGAAAHAAALRDGIGLYRAFNQFRPSQMLKVHHSRLMPAVVVQLGELVGLIYRSDKWRSGRPRTYIHFMDHPPRLVCDTNGTQLYVVGGSYRVRARGIEG